MSDTHTAKQPNETTSEEMATAVSRFESAIASINKSGHSGKPFEFFCISVPDGRAGMSGLDEYPNLVKDDDAKKGTL